MMEGDKTVSWESYFTSDNFKNLAIAIGILLLFLLVRKLFIKYIYSLLIKLSRKSPTELFTQLFLAFEKPFQWLFVIIGIYIAVGYFPYIEQSNELFTQLIRSGIILTLTWGFCNLTSATSILFKGLNNRGNLHLDSILVPFISKGVRLIIIAISLSIIAQVFGYPVNG